MTAAGRYWRTVRHLRAGQIGWRAVRHVQPRVRPAMPPCSVRAATGPWTAPLRRCRSLFDNGIARHAGLEFPYAKASDWSDPDRPLLWTYNLNYFDDLAAGDAPDRREFHQRLLTRWISENRDVSSAAWDPYPTSRRIVNWVKWMLESRATPPEVVRSLALQAQVLSRSLEWHLLANHVLANAVALIFAGGLLDGPAARRWLARGQAILEQQLREQVLPDGGHFERSPMYHSLVLEDLLDLVNLSRHFDLALEDTVLRRIAPMLRWLDTMTHPDGGIALFNDAAFDVAAPPAQLSEYGRRLGIDSSTQGGGRSTILLPDSGFVRLESERAVVIADVGSVAPAYQPAHAHASTLSFELSLDGRRLICDPGVSTYQACPQRMAERGTVAHNTLTVDGENSSEVWASFRVGRRASVTGVSAFQDGSAAVAAARHDGYRHLGGQPVHARHWKLTPGALDVADRIDSARPHEVSLGFQFHPGITLMRDGRAGVVVADPDGRHLCRVTTAVASFNIRDACYHPRFGANVPCQRLVVECTAVPGWQLVSRLEFT